MQMALIKNLCILLSIKFYKLRKKVMTWENIKSGSNTWLLYFISQILSLQLHNAKIKDIYVIWKKNEINKSFIYLLFIVFILIIIVIISFTII